MNLDALQEETDRLLGLLLERHPEQSAWQAAVGERLAAIQKLAAGEPDPTRPFSWLVRIDAAEALVADGFDLARGLGVRRMIERALPYAYGHEFAATVVTAPDPAAIRQAQQGA